MPFFTASPSAYARLRAELPFESIHFPSVISIFLPRIALRAPTQFSTCVEILNFPRSSHKRVLLPQSNNTRRTLPRSTPCLFRRCHNLLRCPQRHRAPKGLL